MVQVIIGASGIGHQGGATINSNPFMYVKPACKRYNVAKRRYDYLNGYDRSSCFKLDHSFGFQGASKGEIKLIGAKSNTNRGGFYLYLINGKTFEVNLGENRIYSFNGAGAKISIFASHSEVKVVFTSQISKKFNTKPMLEFTLNDSPNGQSFTITQEMINSQIIGSGSTNLNADFVNSVNAKITEIKQSNLTSDVQNTQLRTLNQILEELQRNDITLDQAKAIFQSFETTTQEEIESIAEFEESPILYHTVTPLGESGGFELDLVGSQIMKIRHYRELPLLFSEVQELETVGYTISNTSEVSFDDFILQFENPIAYFDNPETIINENVIVVNNKPITIFADGTTSDQNAGIFDKTMAENELKQRIRDAIEDQLSIRENQILNPNLNQNSSNLTIDEIDFIRENQDLVEEFQKTLAKPKDETKINLNGNVSILDQFFEWLRRFTQ